MVLVIQPGDFQDIAHMEGLRVWPILCLMNKKCPEKMWWRISPLALESEREKKNISAVVTRSRKDGTRTITLRWCPGYTLLCSIYSFVCISFQTYGCCCFCVPIIRGTYAWAAVCMGRCSLSLLFLLICPVRPVLTQAWQRRSFLPSLLKRISLKLMRSAPFTHSPHPISFTRPISSLVCVAEPM